MNALILIVGVVESVLLAAALFFIGKKSAGTSNAATDELDRVKREREGILSRFNELYTQMAPIPALRKEAENLRALLESLKAERGRITITQAELETVENRLRELEEIQRELEASGIETKEEISILEKKHRELSMKNDSLKQQLSAALEQMQQIISEVEMSAQAKEQVTAMQTELIQTQQKIDQLLMNVEDGNEQYFIMKKRYDALDIEYAQLYEKFTEAEALAQAAKDRQQG
jgi:chromosome segregation ATPase